MNRPRPTSQGTWTVALVGLQALLLLLIALITLPPTREWHTTDLRIYFTAAQALAEGRVPYRDFALEYPPLALVPFALPRLALAGGEPTVDRFISLFFVQSLLLSTLIAAALARLLADWPAGRRLPSLAIYALLVALCAPLLPWRYDLFPALLTLLALLCVRRGAPGLAGLWLGLGVAAKLYPVVLLPVFGAYYLVAGDWRAILRLGIGFAGAVVAALLPFVLLAPADVFSFLGYHQERGLQLESLPAGVILLGSLLGFGEVSLAYNYGAIHVDSPLAAGALRWLPISFVAASAAAFAVALVRFRRERASAGDVGGPALAAACVAALLAFIVTNKVFSPQYLIWLLPFAPLLRPRQAAIAAGIFLITTIIFPFGYEALLALEVPLVLLLNLRNLMVVALLLWLLAEQLGPWRRAEGAPAVV